MKIPTMEQVEKASHRQLCIYNRFCELASNNVELEVMNRNYERLYKEFGGFTPEISKSIGWDPL